MAKVVRQSTATLSRSTSAGSSSADDEGLEQTYPSNAGSWGYLPEYDYPTPLIVRNTFIDAPLDRAHYLDGHFQERRVQSCPVENPPVDDDECVEIYPSAAHHLRRAATASAAALATAASETATVVKGWWRAAAAESDIPPTMPDQVAFFHETFTAIDTPEGSPVDASNMLSAPPVLLLANVIAEPLSESSQAPPPGSPEMPTIGSAGHWTGDCKPCAFFYKRGCTNGFQCTFCHLCDSGEKKRRQKSKVQQLKEMRHQGLSM